MSGGYGRRVCVGVTLHLREGNQSIWENGAFQNVVFLVQLLQRSPLVEKAFVVVDREHVQGLPSGLMLDGLAIPVIGLRQAMEGLDVVIEMSALLDEKWLLQFQSQGGRNIWMRVGNDYVIDIERAMFDLAPGSLCSRKRISAVWTIPEFEHSCADYFALTARAPVRVLPHLWTPLFIDAGVRCLPEGAHFGFQSGRARWRLLVAEPNVSMVKTALVPMTIAESFYRKYPGSVEVVRVMNAQKLRKHHAFVLMAQMLDLVRHEAVSFDDRLPLYELLALQADAVISHHWENGQNYLYYEVLYGGYPLIHNSVFIRDQGYFYPDFDCDAGRDALADAVALHDGNLSTYRARASSLLKQLDVGHEDNVRVYTEALGGVLMSPLL